MYDLLHKHKRIAQVILALISLPFAFFGVDYYFRSGDSAAGVVATYKGGRITQAEFAQALRDQQENLQRAQRPFDPAMFDNPDVRFQILQQLLRQRDHREEGRRPAFPRDQRAGVRPDRGGSPLPGGRQVLSRRLQGGARGRADPGGVVRGQRAPADPRRSLRRSDRARQHRRAPDPRGLRHAARAGARSRGRDDRQRAAARATSRSTLRPSRPSTTRMRRCFKTPEEVSFEYLILTPDTLAADVTVTPDEVKAQYAATAKQYTQDEQRQAAHILIAVKPDASAADKAAAKKKAEDVLAQAKANPAKFAELAKQYSQDPGSAAQGGDLGSNPRGTMVKAFDDAVFSAKPGEIVGPGRDGVRLSRDQAQRHHAGALARNRRGPAADRGRPQAAEGDAEVRGGGGSVPEPRVRAGRYAGGRCQGAQPDGEDLRPRDAGQGAGARAGECKVHPGAVEPGIAVSEAEHRGDRDRTEHADGRTRRRVQAGRAAALRPGEGRDPAAARRAAGERDGAGARPRKARGAGAGQDRQGGRPHVRQSGDAAPQSDAARISARGGGADLPGRSRRSCRDTSARRTSGAVTRSTRS